MELQVVNLGFKGYKSILDLQRKIWELRGENYLPDTLLLVEHDHTITLGRSADKEDLLLTPDEIQNLGISVYEVERGGECTYHGPGQLVGYPIVKLENERGIISLFVAKLEEVMIKTLEEFGIMSSRRVGFPGVWVGQQKTGSVGVAVRRWVTYHGFALNVNTDLSFFRFIRPCGQDRQVMTSMAQIMGQNLDMAEVASAITRQFSEIFGARIISVDDKDVAQAGVAGSQVCI